MITLRTNQQRNTIGDHQIHILLTSTIKQVILVQCIHIVDLLYMYKNQTAMIYGHRI